LFGSQGGANAIASLKAAIKKGYDYRCQKLFDHPHFNKLLAGILEFDPERRMSPEEILRSEFLNQRSEEAE